MSWKVVLGTLFLFSGVVIVSLHNYTTETYLLIGRYTESSKFQVSGYFAKGDKLVFDLVPNKDWSTLYFDWFLRTDFIPDYEDARIQVEIKNTFGEKTVLDIIYILYTTISGEDVLTTYAVTVNYTSGELENLQKPTVAGLMEGIVAREGNYSASLLTPESLYQINSPPQSITLRRYEKRILYEYRHISPLGFPLIVLGVITLFLGKFKKVKLREKRA
ncbi:MAG: hypothetical protein ACQXXG_05615 [Candidatus Bathyarchaeia archaeon]